MASRLNFTPPEQFEEYRILRPLGGGTMGQVYLAHDTLLDRPVAIKFIANFDITQASASEMHERFFIEARAIARLQHPNVVLIYRVGEWQQRPYLVSEFVQGQSLDRIEKPLPWQRVHRIGVGLSRGLAAAHRRGVLHRDIKPANAMLTPTDDVKILDFGLAKLVDVTQAAGGAAAGSGGAPTQEVPACDPHASLQSLSTSLQGINVELSATLPAVNRSLSNQQAVALDATLLPSETDPPLDLELRDTAGPSDGGLTQIGDVIGSPLYMAPEIWRAEPATRQADIYSLGTLLYELCSGRAPFEGLSLAELPLCVQERDARPLADVVSDADPRFCAIVDRCLRRDPAARFESGDALRAALEQLSGAAIGAASVPEGNPYRGLQSFEKQHRGLFFGRSAEVGAILDRLRSESLVLVAGNSGVGKSSLCKAGVLAQVEAGALGPVRVAPWLPGRRPLGALAIALAAVLEIDETSLRRDMENDPQQIGRALSQRNRQTHRQNEPPLRVLLFVDQMEELLTQADPAEAAVVGEALTALIAYSPDVRLLGTVRGDFLSRLLALPGIGSEVARGLHLLGPLGPDSLRDAIIQPALALGYAFESASLVESLVTAAGNSDGGLPLLQFTLAALWEARDLERRIIPASALQALGGVGGALARHADQVYGKLLPRQQLAARRILGQLITVEGTRTSKRRDELLGSAGERDAAAGALEALVAGRILSVRSDESGADSAFELAHEALLTSWGSMRVWLAEDAQLRALRQRLAHAASEWERLGQSRDLLWQKRRLAEATALSDAEADDLLAPREAAFLRASRRAVRLQRLGWAALIGAVPLLLVLIYAGVSLRARQALNEKIDEHTVRAESELALARDLRQRSLALRQVAWHLFDSRQMMEGEKQWEKVVALESDTLHRYHLASLTAEAAFLLDVTRQDQRRLVANILFENALLGERGSRISGHDDLYQRLLLYDKDGTFQQLWEAPATVELDSEPRGATVSLTPISANYHLLVNAKRSLGRTPLQGLTLPPGGYLLTIAAPGRIEVKYPLSLRRSESLSLHIPMPTADQVPPGYVYVPAGRFLFGSDADDGERRDFLYHVPLHQSSTGSFLIAQHETTFADWLAFLRTLPLSERQKRMPRASQAGGSGWLELRQLEDGAFELSMQPTKQLYRAREGEHVIYPGRRLRREQDWLRMPVTGISSEDALAYAGWLQSSGRLPGARLCTEQEWERAARGADNRIYPHGDRLESDDANHDRTYGQEPLGMGLDEVGSHPRSSSLLGVDDLVGNAFEWVSNGVSQKPFVIRGGAYYYGLRTDRIDNRQEVESSVHNPTVGLRICANIRPDK